MKRTATPFRIWLLGFGLTLAACGSATRNGQVGAAGTGGAGGTAGAAGATGVAGAGGTAGAVGTAGAAGTVGTTGAAGTGAAGTTGAGGAVGTAGATGVAGSTGGTAGNGGGAGCSLSASFGAPTLLAGLNSPKMDDGLSFSADGKVAWFTSEREGGSGKRDLWTATRGGPSGVFGTPTVVGVVNSAFDEEVPRASADGLTLLFGSNRDAAKGYDIYVATRDNVLAEFPAPSLLANVNSTATDSDLYVTASGKRLYFSSDRGRDPEDYDIYVATADAGGTFGQPVPLPGIVNTSAREATSVVSGNELTLYFGRRQNKEDDYDIFVARRANVTDPFNEVALVAELNTPKDDFPVEISADGCTLYISSKDRPGGMGDRDIYVAQRGR